MKRLGGRGRDFQRGATAVITAIVMVVLLAFAAISIDVGMMYAEKAQLQNGADSAALAVALDCAKSTSSASCTSSPNLTAATLVNANANDAKANTNSVTVDKVARNVKVDVSSKNSSDKNFIQLTFAKVLGQDKVTVGASATAVWPAAATLVAIPWTIGDCQFKASLSQAQKDAVKDSTPFPIDPSKTPLYMRSDTNASYPGCTAGAGYADGGFGWLKPQDSKCLSIPASSPYSIPGYTGNASQKVLDDPVCSGLLDSLFEKDSYIPIFSSSTASGNNAVYTLTGFAIFHVTGWHFNPPDKDGTNPPACLPNGNKCRGFFGYFKGYISIMSYLAIQPGSDDKTVRLIK